LTAAFDWGDECRAYGACDDEARLVEYAPQKRPRRRDRVGCRRQIS